MENNKFSFKEVLRLSFRGYKIWWNKAPLLLVTSFINAVVGALTPYAGIYIAAQLINEIAGNRDRDRLIFWVLVALISAIVLSLMNAVLMRWKSYHHASTHFKLEAIYSDKLLSMDFCRADDARTYGLLSNIRQNSEAFDGKGLPTLLRDFESGVRALLTIIAAVSLTVSLFTLRIPDGAGSITVLNHPLFIIPLIFIMLTVTFTVPLFSAKAYAYWLQSVEEKSKLSNRCLRFFSSLGISAARSMDLRIYRQDVLLKQNLDRVYGRDKQSIYYAIFYKSQLIKRISLYITGVIVSHFFTIAVYIFVCLKAWGGAFGVGSVTQYIGAVTALSGGVSALITFFTDMRNNASFLRTVYEFLDIPNEMYQGSLTTEKRSDNKYEVEFRNVSFKYAPEAPYVLKNVSLTFKIGQRLAIVGENGSGKTTFIKLLCRLYDPTEGEILLNGINIRKYDYRQYMSIFSVVFQDYELLSFELGQNVAASVHYEEDKATDCLIRAGFGERLNTMPNGLKTYLYKNFEEEGINISGGEAQKIAIARALYNDAPFMILDEPTAALDPIAEFELYNKMNEIIEDKTAVFISHRLSSCRFCSDIAVFHEGELVQRGDHGTLVADEDGKYHALWSAQAQYYTETSA